MSSFRAMLRTPFLALAVAVAACGDGTTTGPPAGSAAALAFLTQPETAEGQVPFGPVEVAVVDASGNRLTGAAADVTLALSVSPSGEALGGSTVATPVDGVATFSDLTFALPGEGSVLQATSAGLAPAVTPECHALRGPLAVVTPHGWAPSDRFGGCPTPRSSVGDGRLDLLRGLDEAGDLRLGGGGLGQLVPRVGLRHRSCQVRGVPGAELLDGVHTGGVEDLGELLADPLHTHEVRQIHPAQDPLLVDPRGRGQILAPLLGAGLLDKVIGVPHARFFQLGPKCRTDAFDLIDAIGHVRFSSNSVEQVVRLPGPEIIRCTGRRVGGRILPLVPGAVNAVILRYGKFDFHAG